jgi:hypothetical protein
LLGVFSPKFFPEGITQFSPVIHTHIKDAYVFAVGFFHGKNGYIRTLTRNVSTDVTDIV